MAGKREKVVLAMSGGVDSSVAACLLVEQGCDVIGLFMRVGAPGPAPGGDGAGVAHHSSAIGAATVRERLNDVGATGPLPNGRGSDRDKTSSSKDMSRHQGCCSASDAADARFVAGMLGIPFYVLNFQEDFNRLIDYFADEYISGRTPNPCVVCNDKFKFGKLVDYADAVGAKYIATGHYARIGEYSRHREDRLDRCHKVLMRARDARKDQTYVLFGLNRTRLDRVLFPIGELTKVEVRETAARFNLPNRDKPDSVEICFVPDRDYARVVRERRPEAFTEGDVLDSEGRVIGRHKGIGNYTIGQRRGLGIAAGKPIYVTELNVLDNTVTMGEGDDLLEPALIADGANFFIDPPDGPFRADVKIRYLHQAAPAMVEVLPSASRSETPHGLKPAMGGIPDTVGSARGMPDTVGPRGGMPHAVGPTFQSVKVRVIFDKPQRAITPGQAVVFYDGDVVLGGAWIERAESEVS